MHPWSSSRRLARRYLQRLSPRHRWWAETWVRFTLTMLVGAAAIFGAFVVPMRWWSVTLAALGGLDVGSAIWTVLNRSTARAHWRWGWSVGFAAAWHTQHVVSEGGVPTPILRAMTDPDGSPVPEPWDDWTADLHPPTDPPA
jgi:hypothetical protein